MALDVYLVCVVLKPTAKAIHDEGAVPTIIVQPTAVIADGEQSAAMKAARLVPEEHAPNADRLDVRVIPFGRARQ